MDAFHWGRAVIGGISVLKMSELTSRYYWMLGEPAEEECSNARYAVLDLLH